MKPNGMRHIKARRISPSVIAGIILTILLYALMRITGM